MSDPDMAASEEAGGEREKKVSLLWLFIILPFLAFSMWTVLAPRIEVYTGLVCKVIRPEYPEVTHLQYASRGHLSGVAHHLFKGALVVDASGKVPGRKSCASDPVVQAGVSKLIAVLTTCSGIVSCITTSWWGSISDRYGRNSVLGISVLGITLAHLNTIFVSWFVMRLPGNYWFLLVGSIIEGLGGGASAVSATIESYVVDCTDASSRSRMLTIAGGVLSIGMALGPMIGGLLIRTFHQVLPAFYGAIVLLLCLAVIILTLLPESLSQEQKLANRNAYAAQQQGRSVWVKVFTPLAPLSIFFPTKYDTAPGTSGQSGRDWNLTLVAAAYASAVMVLVPLDYMFQYTSYAFGWTGEMISYWLTLHGIGKAIFLSLILPTWIKWINPNSPATKRPMETSESSHLLAPLNEDPLPDSITSQLPSLEEVHASTFDLALARLSLLIYLISFAFRGLVPTPWIFMLASILGEVGSGFTSGLLSVAVEVYKQREHQIRGEFGMVPVEVGKLYGSLSVVHAFCAQLLGPGLLALTFMFTVASVPSAVFLVAGLAILFSIFLLSFLQLPKASLDHIQGHDQHSMMEDFVEPDIQDLALL